MDTDVAGFDPCNTLKCPNKLCEIYAIIACAMGDFMGTYMGY